MFYHISATKGLTELEPRVSTHGKSWVYALTDASIGLIFAGRDNIGNKADDMFTKYGVTPENIPEVFELYSGCLDEILKNKDCYIYELEDSGFMQNQTSWHPEWVSPKKTKVVGVKYISDILSEINRLEKEGKFVIHYYENTPSYNQFVESRIKPILSKNDWINVSLIKHYPQIVKKYVNENIENNYRKDYDNLTKQELKEVFEKLDKDNNKGLYVRKELLYLYPKETIEWINKKYENSKNIEFSK